ncbi:SGNH/GDSL hydrolase family protein [Zafaria sp. J156]|uniref:SGNH/GDSL hydrolase family protein n=1 Tax=Zafaria sp. J156 TaxID=3116490 RepID=UPI002E7A552E|nr:SGNH/GDSL hydrolase family protein [Zafaria sp. J156]MEE1620412.1 SGNH/GDSL hydrolase family protein [Zafaria sp. J156]
MGSAHRRPRVVWAAVAAGALLAVAAGAGVLAQGAEQGPAVARGAVQPAALGWSDAGSTGTVFNAASGRQELEYPEPRRLAVLIGDSQSDGAAGVPGEATWPRLALTAAGYDVVFRGRGGTGFTAARPPYLDYADALRTQQWLLPHGDVGLVVLQGGGNDARAGASDAEVHAGVTGLVEEVRRSYPTSTILVVGTLARSLEDGGGRRHAVDAAVGTAARDAGLAFISAGDWITTEDLGGHLLDRAHLDEAGHRIAAERFLEELRLRGLMRSELLLAGGAEAPAS